MTTASYLHSMRRMYTPPAFREPDQNKAFGWIERNSFGVLVSSHRGESCASHLPLLLERGAGLHGTLVGHMARANPQWQQAEGQEVLAVFPGPHAYISPTWYEAKSVVPTWNYIAVHAYGQFHAVQEPESLMKILAAYVRFYEAAMPEPWTLDSGSEFIQTLSQAVVGFRIEIMRLEAKCKLSQNHPKERREKVIAALEGHTDQNDRAIAAMVRENLR